jgi:hypothetical protein
MAAHDLDLAKIELVVMLVNQDHLPTHFHISGRFCNWSAWTQDRVEEMCLP